MRAAVIALASLITFAGIGAVAVSLLPSADSAPLHPIQVNAPQIAPVAPQAPVSSPPVPAATPPPGPSPAPAQPPRTQANLRDIPDPPPPLVTSGDSDDWDDDWDDDDGDGDDDGDD